jgi:hypothetical protein
LEEIIELECDGDIHIDIRKEEDQVLESVVEDRGEKMKKGNRPLSIREEIKKFLK